MFVITETDGPATIFYLTDGKNKIELQRRYEATENKIGRITNEYNQMVDLVEAMIKLSEME